MTREEILEILKNSQVLKIANLECFSTNSDIFVYFKDMDLDSKVFETKLLQLKDKFILRAFCDKTDFSYEYVRQDSLLIEAVNLKKFYENIEILSVTKNNEVDISINITNSKDNNAVMSIGKQSLAFTLNEKDYSMRLRVDFGINEVIRYQERNKNQTFNLNIKKENRETILSACNTIDNKIIGEKTNLSFKSINSTIYDFIDTKHINSIIDYMLFNIFMKKTSIKNINRSNFRIYDKLFFNRLYESNDKLEKIIETRKVLNFEKNNQKKLLIKK